MVSWSLLWCFIDPFQSIHNPHSVPPLALFSTHWRKGTTNTTLCCLSRRHLLRVSRCGRCVCLFSNYSDASRVLTQPLHVYPLGYIWNCYHERAYVAAGLGSSGIDVLRGRGQQLSSLIPTWVDMLQAASAWFIIGGGNSVFMHFVYPRPTHRFHYIRHEQSRSCLPVTHSNFVAGASFAGNSRHVDVLEKVQSSQFLPLDVLAQNVYRN
jgi:hypothetical protein